MKPAKKVPILSFDQYLGVFNATRTAAMRPILREFKRLLMKMPSREIVYPDQWSRPLVHWTVEGYDPETGCEGPCLRLARVNYLRLEGGDVVVAIQEEHGEPEETFLRDEDPSTALSLFESVLRGEADPYTADLPF